ncbi:RICIN domain-containing protein, partial [Collinsella aerofaciens]|uniref:RICIN domain-containing protein n=2 Tax=Collinsella aerofaciens TaxID=74426 RepID=UPI0011068E72
MRKPASCVLSIALSLVMTVGFIPSPALAEIASAPEPAAQSAGKPNESPAETTSGQARANDQISAASGTNVTANATQPIDASMFSIEDTDIRYTGNPVMPTVTSSTVPSDQYTVAYENNVAIGQATAVVTADDQNYSGTCAIPFEIKPANAAANYQHSTTAQSGDITLTVQWNDPRLGQETTFHVTATGGSGAYQFRMDAPTYMDPDGSSESVADPSRNQWQQYTGECTSHDYQFEMTASGTYYLRFYLMDKAAGVYYLRSNVFASANDDAYPAVSAIVKSAVDKCSADTDGSDYARALWLHDWTLDQLEYDHSLNWCSAESGLTRHQGTCESYQRIYSKLLDAAGIANGRITGNGHTWNAVKIDGKWCQMDLTWDDTSDNWYGDLDQRHLYFGLTDELMAIAHSDHTANYQKDGYAYRSTDLSNNYFVRNGKADEWAEKYADRIQQHLDAREESFSIDADNQSFPPSISGIQNGIVAYAMNQREWKSDNAKVGLSVTSNVTKESNNKWSAKYDLKAEYKIAALEKVIDDGDYRLSISLDARMAVSASGSGCKLSASAGALTFERDGATGLYRISSGGRLLTEAGSSAVLAEPDGSASQLWRVAASGGAYTVTSASGLALDDDARRTSEGNRVWLYEPNGTPAQKWLLADPAIPRTVDDGDYRLSISLDARMAVSASGSGCKLSASAGALTFERDGATGLYRISSGGRLLTEAGSSAVLAEPDGSASQLWRVAASGGAYTVTSASGLALDDDARRTSEGNRVWLYEPNGTPA